MSPLREQLAAHDQAVAAAHGQVRTVQQQAEAAKRDVGARREELTRLLADLDDPSATPREGTPAVQAQAAYEQALKEPANRRP